MNERKFSFLSTFELIDALKLDWQSYYIPYGAPSARKGCYEFRRDMIEELRLRLEEEYASCSK